MTVRELLNKVDSVELTEWLALWNLEVEEAKQAALAAKAAAKERELRRRRGGRWRGNR